MTDRYEIEPRAEKDPSFLLEERAHWQARIEFAARKIAQIDQLLKSANVIFVEDERWQNRNV